MLIRVRVLTLGWVGYSACGSAMPNKSISRQLQRAFKAAKLKSFEVFWHIE